jgi:hypothetical protein
MVASAATPSPCTAREKCRRVSRIAASPNGSSLSLRNRATSLVQYLVEIEQLIRKHRERCEFIHGRSHPL